MKKKINLCHAGDIVIHQGRKMEVTQVICAGREDKPLKKSIQKGYKSMISAYPIMADNGQVLRRSPKYIGDDWKLYKTVLPVKRWAGKYDRCVECHTTERKHRGRGLCHSCYGRMLRGGRMI